MLGALGKRERDAGDPELSAEERPVVRRQVGRIMLWSVLIAAVATAIAWVLP